MVRRRLYIKKFILFTLVCLVGVSFVIEFVHAMGGSAIIAQEHFRLYDDDGTTVDNATPKAAVDASSTVNVGEKFHIRLGALQTFNQPDTDLARTIKLQYSSDAAGDCTGGTGSWVDVPTESGWVAQAFRQITTDNFTDGDTTTRQLDADHTHIGGDGVDNDGSPVTVNITSGASQNSEHAEWEWALEEKAGTTGQSYWFRFINSDDTTTNITWTICAALTVPAANAPPVVSNVALDGGTAITLTENTTKAVSATADVSDPNGADDIISATSTIYRSGVGAGCTADDENCYKIASCTFSGATSTVTCTANIQFFADPTDASSTAYSAQNWLAEITVTDSASATGASSTLSGVELNTLWAIDITATINYGAVSPTADTGSTNQSVTVTNTGNAAIDIEASGTDITLGGSTIGVANQKYATSTFTYSSCTVCTALSSTPAAYEVDLLKPTSATPVTDLIYWGLAVPNGTAQGVHSGTNTFTAIGD